MDMAIKDEVQNKYASIARKRSPEFSNGELALARVFGYSQRDLESIPEEANLGVSCGNPTAMASLRSGEVVVDLGSGGGMDVFLAARNVGRTGKSIGIDMTPEMIELANRNLARTDFDNVEFHLAEIESMPLESASVDCVISNCVLNLVPDKEKAFREIFRILKPGGRLAVSDIALRKLPPAERANDVKSLTGCIAGAILIGTYREMLERAGFTSVEIVDARRDLNAYHRLRAGDVEGCAFADDADFDVNEYAASVRVLALK